MTWRTALTRAIWRIETLVDRLRPARPVQRAAIEPYLGHSTPEGLVLRGRILVSRPAPEARPDQGRLTNLRQMAGRFLTRELGGVTVEAPDAGVSAVSDEEGYFSLVLPRREVSPGSARLAVQIAGRPESRVDLEAIVTDPRASFGVISDIDDTMMRTDAYSLPRNLWTTFTSNSATRIVFPDAVEFVARLHDGRNPVFYVSSSPWNLHDLLASVFERAGLVRGPLFLRDLGIDRDRLISGGHGAHKGAAIDAVLAANPGLPFVLIGDTGQHDAEIYLAAARRHPGRVRRIVLRAPGPGADAEDKRHAAAAAALGIDVSIGRDYRSLIRIRPGERAEPDREAT